jgi:hypothetical protein
MRACPPVPMLSICISAAQWKMVSCSGGRTALLCQPHSCTAASEPPVTEGRVGRLQLQKRQCTVSTLP